MPSLNVIRTLLREVVTPGRLPRVCEPDLVMDDPDKVAAYTRAGREDGVMAPVYLFHCAQVCELVRPGDRVVDLACGPATQLAMIARLNPGADFIGIDLSDDMLVRARELVEAQQLRNIRLERGDITDLSRFEDASVDVVFSTMALHHLPDEAALDRTLAEVARILKPDGGLYLVDFGHLKSEKSIRYFAYQYADRQPELFTLDYLYSLQAAFHKDTFQRLVQRHLAGRARFYSTFLAPFMVAVKAARPHGKVEPQVLRGLQQLKAQLPPHHQVDLKDLRTFFRLGGLGSPLLD